MAYITLSDVTTFINAPSLTTPQQNQVTAIIPAVEAFLETACNRTWNVTAEQTETFDGGQTVYFPKHTPITTVGSITDDGVTQVENTDFYTYPTYIRFLS